MKIVILGVSGLIGHKLYQRLSQRFDLVHGVMHGQLERFSGFGIFDPEQITEGVDVSDFEAVAAVLDKEKPDVVLNCAGITKRRPEINIPLKAISVNALFPHLLAQWAEKNTCRVIHFSSDCVFDGATGMYTEQSPTTAKDAYGQTKALGELHYDHCLTIRSSFIGRELSVHSELLDWFLQQEGKTIKGFKQAWYSGISTLEMSRIIGDIIENHPDISGLNQLSIDGRISKYDLLCLARDSFEVDVEIVADDSIFIDATLDGSLLRSKMDIQLPDWPTMMADLAEDAGMYGRLA